MKIGIIAEGRGDQAVLCNLCYGLGLADKASDFVYIRPEYNMDATDRHNMSAEAFSSWTLVRQDCIDGTKFETHLNSPLGGERIMLVQIDTAECELANYEVERPSREDENYCSLLRERVIAKIQEWLGKEYDGQIFYAICIEEMEAWVHTLYENKDTSLKVDSKKAFEKHLRTLRKDKNWSKKENKLKSKGAFAQMEFYSADFEKLHKSKTRKCLDNNESLRDFVKSLEDKQLA